VCPRLRQDRAAMPDECGLWASDQLPKQLCSRCTSRVDRGCPCVVPSASCPKKCRVAAARLAASRAGVAASAVEADHPTPDSMGAEARPGLTNAEPARRDAHSPHDDDDRSRRGQSQVRRCSSKALALPPVRVGSSLFPSPAILCSPGPLRRSDAHTV
jgi:hypothetical protein